MARKPKQRTAYQERALELARTIDDAVDLFKEAFPEDWGSVRTMPAESMAKHMAAKLRSLGS